MDSDTSCSVASGQLDSTALFTALFSIYLFLFKAPVDCVELNENQFLSLVASIKSESI